MGYGLTVRDVIDHLRDWSGGNSGVNSENNIRHAIQLAMVDLVEPRPWTYYSKLYRIFLQAPYSTGTITYDHTGGTSERLVTFSGSTLPADIAVNPSGWDLVVGDVVARVSGYLSATTLQLDENLNFGEDVAAGTSFQLLKSRYLLPEDFRCLNDGVAESLWCARYVQPYEWLQQQHIVSSSGPPSIWTIVGDDLNRYRSMMIVNPAPAEAEKLDVWYQRKARDLIFSGYNSRESIGTVSATGSTVTGSGTAFESGMIGSIMRFGATNAEIPDGRFGVEPYTDERRIVAVASATSLTLDSAVSATITNKKYVISDPIDIDPCMEPAFARGVEYNLSVLKKSSTAEQERTYGAYMVAKDAAFGSDRKAYGVRFAGDGRSGFARSLGNMRYDGTVIE